MAANEGDHAAAASVPNHVSAQHADDGEERFAAILAAMDAEVAGERPRDGGMVGPESTLLQGRLKESRQVLELLEAMWPRRGHRGTSAEVPARIGRFEIRRPLGCGGFATVYLAFDPLRGGEVALKVPKWNARATPELLQRFLREAKAGAALDHPNVVPLYEVGEAGAVWYLSSAYVAGPTLAQWRQGRTIAPRQAALIVAALATGVAHVHSRGILHRDIKPTNVLLDFSESACATERLGFVPRLTDFGLAKLDSVAPGEGEMTRTGAILGTPAYMAPEQAEGRHDQIGVATDVHALGVILYELLAGAAPFRGATDVATLQKIAIEEPPSLRLPGVKVPRDLEAICLKCLAKQPAYRYATAADLAEDLANFLNGIPTKARPLPMLHRAAKWVRRSPMEAAFAATLAMGFVGILASTIWYALEQHQYANELKKLNDELSDAIKRERAQSVLAQDQASQLRLNAYADRFALGLESWKQGRHVQAIDQLDESAFGVGQPDLRGFEWHYLKSLCHPLQAVRRGHRGAVVSLAVSRDGKLLASGDARGDIRICDAASGEFRASFSGHSNAADFLAFSPDGRTLASAAVVKGDGELILWDVPTVRSRAKVRIENAPMLRGEYTPDGKLLALSTLHGFGFWDADTGERRRFHADPKLKVCGMTLSPDGRTIATGHDDGSVKIWDSETITEQAQLRGHTHPIWAVAFSPDGKTLATGSDDYTLRLWDLASGKQKAALPHRYLPRLLAFSSDGRVLASVANGSDPVGNWADVKTWDAVTAIPLATHEHRSLVVRSMVFVPNTRSLAIACNDKTIRLLDTHPSPVSKQLPGHSPKETWALAYAPDGRTLASAGDDGQVRLWDAASGEPIVVLQGHKELVTSIDYSRDGKTLASASHDGTVKLWDTVTNKLRTTLAAPNVKLRCVALAPHAPIVAAGTQTKGEAEVRLWETDTGRELPALGGHNKKVRCVAFSPDGALLVSGSEDGILRWWDTATWELRGKSLDTDEVTCLSFAPDGKTVASGNSAGDVRVWHSVDGREKYLARGHIGEVYAIAFAPDGRSLASAGHDKTVRLWQAATGKELMMIEGHHERVNALAFARNGRALASASHDGVIKVWDSASEPSNKAASWHYPFGKDGSVATPLDVQAEAATIELQPDGKILIAGNCIKNGSKKQIQSLMMRYHSNGELDATFGTAGIVKSDFQTYCQDSTCLKALPNGKIAAVGNLLMKENSSTDISLMRFLSDGKLDLSFQGQGFTAFDFFNDGDVAIAQVTQPDGKFVVLGIVTKEGRRVLGLARFTSEGVLDTTFGTNGKRTLEFGQGDHRWYLNNLALQNDGKLLAAGATADLSFIVRLMPNGKLDDSFADKGVAFIAAPPNQVSYRSSLHLLADGRVVGVQSFMSADRPSVFLTRYTANGQRDLEFGNGGQVVFHPPGFFQPTLTAAYSDGRIVISCWEKDNASSFSLVRYLPNGQIDRSFGQEGRAIVPFNGKGEVRNFAIQPDGKLIVVGIVRRGKQPLTIVLYRFQHNGQLDAPGVITRPSAAK